MIEEPYPPYIKDKDSGKVFPFSLPLIEGTRNEYVACYTPEGDETNPNPPVQIVQDTIKAGVESEEESRRKFEVECGTGKYLAFKLIEHLLRMGAGTMELPVKIAGKEYVVIGRPINQVKVNTEKLSPEVAHLIRKHEKRNLFCRGYDVLKLMIKGGN